MDAFTATGFDGNMERGIYQLNMTLVISDAEAIELKKPESVTFARYQGILSAVVSIYCRYTVHSLKGPVTPGRSEFI